MPKSQQTLSPVAALLAHYWIRLAQTRTNRVGEERAAYRFTKRQGEKSER